MLLMNMYLELIKKCPCEIEPPEDWLIVPPEARDKRSAKDDPLLGTVDAEGLVYGCEDATDISSDDILLRYEQVVKLIKNQKKCCKGSDKGQIRNKRQFIIIEGREMNLTIWKMPIIYSFSSYIEGDWIKNINTSLMTLSEMTCIKFQQVSRKVPHDFEFMNIGNFCSSHVGNYWKKRSEDTKIRSHHVNVPWPRCGTIGIIIHETMHALGLQHEMSRNDRDKSANTLNFGLPYDYASIMHYGATDFALDGNKYTIVALKHAYQNSMGEYEPTFKDVKLLNRLYCRK
uniref:Metalloendopeptidase n=1 Tax=Meloidogyne floridensis TaxID=298350 RepID=A0A915P3P8_9BILA